MSHRTWRFPLSMAALTLLAVAIAARSRREQLDPGIRHWNLLGSDRLSRPILDALNWAIRSKDTAMAGLLVLTVGVGTLAIGRRRGRRGSWPGRGRAALLAANLALAWGILFLLVESPPTGPRFWASESGFFQACRMLGYSPPLWVLGAWTCLAYAGCWRGRGGPPDGPEQVGRLVGWCWLVLLVGFWIEWAGR